jgi:hypothetical protein
VTFTIPNIESSPTFDGQSVPDATDWSAVTLAENGTYVVSGMGVTPSSGMTVAIAAGTFSIAGGQYTYAGGTTTVGAASATDRRDIISINSSGTITVTAGTPCGTAGWTRSSSGLPPVKPAIPASNVILAEIYVSSTTTTVASGNIIDKTLVVGNNVYLPSCVFSAASTSLASNTWTTVNSNGSPILYNGMTASGQGVAVPRTGTYLFVAQMINTVWGGGSSRWRIGFTINSGGNNEVVSALYNANDAAWLSGSRVINLNSADVVQMTAFENAGATTLGAGNAIWSLTWLGRAV